MVGLGFVFGLWAAARRARAVGINPDHMYDLVFPWILVGGMLGARLLYVISYWDRDFAGQPFTDVFQIWRGGLVFYGGLLGAVLAAMYRIRKLKLPLWKTADCFAPSIALGHAFGRIGCLLNGCCFGRPSDLPWAVNFPNNQIVLADGSYLNHAVHPSQVYETLLNLGLFGVLTWLHGRRKFDGQIFALYLISYALIRGFTEFFRGDYNVLSQPARGILTPGQWSGFVVLAAGIALMWILKRGAKPDVKDVPSAK